MAVQNHNETRVSTIWAIKDIIYVLFVTALLPWNEVLDKLCILWELFKGKLQNEVVVQASPRSPNFPQPSLSFLDLDKSTFSKKGRKGARIGARRVMSVFQAMFDC